MCRAYYCVEIASSTGSGSDFGGAGGSGCPGSFDGKETLLSIRGFGGGYGICECPVLEALSVAFSCDLALQNGG
jgi:hypothetical protein